MRTLRLVAMSLALIATQAWAASQMEITGGGSVLFDGSSSGGITMQPQAAAGTYNFNLPTGAGTSGQPLLSGGGGSTAETWGTLGVGAGGTGLTATPSNGQIPIGNASGFSLSTITAGSGITVTNGPGTITVAAIGGSVLSGYFSGCVMRNDASTTNELDIGSCAATDSTTTVAMSASSGNVTLTTSGINGLDTGSPATSTWYGIFLVNGSSGTGFLASAVQTQTISGNGSSTGASVTAGGTTLTLSSSLSTALSAGAIIYVEGAGETNGTNHGGQSNVIVSGSGTSYTVADAWYSSTTDTNFSSNQFSNGGGPTMPTGYTYYRLIGEMETQSSGSPVPWIIFKQSGQSVEIPAVTDVSNQAGVLNTGTVYALSVPKMIGVNPRTAITVTASQGTACLNPGFPPTTPNTGNVNPSQDNAGSNQQGLAACSMTVTNAQGQVRIVGSSTGSNFYLFTRGWRYLPQVTQ